MLVSTGLRQEVYAKLTVFTNVYLRSVPITRQGPLVSKLGLNKPEKQHRQEVSVSTTSWHCWRAESNGYSDSRNQFKGGREVKFLCKFNTRHLITVIVTAVYVLTATPAIFLQNVCCELVTFFFLIHRLFTIICDYFCKWVYVWGEGVKVRNSMFLYCITGYILNESMLHFSLSRKKKKIMSQKGRVYFLCQDVFRFLRCLNSCSCF